MAYGIRAEPMGDQVEGGEEGAGLGGMGAAEEEAEVVEEEELDEEEELVEDDFEDLLDDPEYRSAYQPPPLRMKLPEETRRLACLALQAGQTSTGGSTILCSSSH